MTRPVLIMKTGETLAALRARGEDFENWIGTGLGLSPTQWCVGHVALAYELPVLGICYGHQLLAHACGGHVDYHPLGREIGTVPVTLAPAARDDVLLGALPGCFVAQTTHSQSVLQLPPAATLLASSAHDGHQAYRVGARAWGVQFHPEFSAAVMRTYVRERQQALQAEGFDVDALLRGVQDTPAANGILRRFAALCGY
jgi:GMP synthase (glutamine-hydrolysing)